MSFEDYTRILPSIFQQAEPQSRSQSEQTAETLLAPGQNLANSHANSIPDEPTIKLVSPEAKSNPDVPPTRMIRFADVTEIQNHGLSGVAVEVVPTERFPPVPQKIAKAMKKFDEYSVILRRTVLQTSRRYIALTTELEIQSPSLQEAFRNLVVDVYDQIDLQTNPIKIPSPFCELFFARDKIKKYVEDESNTATAKKEMKLLLDFINDEKGEIHATVMEHEKLLSERHISSNLQWTIYPPNSMVIFSRGPVQECYLCRNVLYEFDDNGLPYVEFHGSRMECDGYTVGLTKMTFKLDVFPGTRKISNLALIPWELLEDREKIEARLLKRGARYTELLKHGWSHWRYKGPVWHKLENVFPDRERNERVLVDPSLFYNEFPALRPTMIKPPKKKKPVEEEPVYEPKASKVPTKPKRPPEPSGPPPPPPPRQWGGGPPHPPPPRRRSSSVSSSVSLISSISSVSTAFPPPVRPRVGQLLEVGFPVVADGRLCGVPEKVGLSYDPLLLFPALIPSLGLAEKRWGMSLIEDVFLKEIDWSKDAFKTLQLKSGTKELILALAQGHQSGNLSTFDDVIPGKGKSLIFLLKGEPGLGKTLTAEGLAEELHRPLYAISGGELSTNVREVEEKLFKIFRVAKRWKAIVLLDEAEVLLARRRTQELDRNSVVAVFLRMVEYYEGILILTTNR